MKRLDAARWIVGSATLVACALALRGPIDPAYWWHLTLGRVLSVHHAVAVINPFVYAAPADAPVLFQSWIGQFWLYELHVMGGAALVASLRNLLCAATVAALGAATWARSRHIGSTAVATVTVGCAASWGISLAPEMFAFPLALASALLCFAIHDRPASKLNFDLALGLVLMAAFWANLAPGYGVPALTAAGFAVANARRAETRRRSAIFAVTSLAALAATLLTPRGVETWSTLPESASLAVITALFVAQLAFAPRFGERAPAQRPRLVSALTILACVAVALVLQPWLLINPSLTTALYSTSVRQTEPLRGLAPSNLPVEPVELVRSWGSSPRVFIAPEHAGYYLFHVADATPRPLVWRDLSGLPAEATVALVEELERNPESLWRGMFQQWGVKAAILERSRNAALIDAISRAEDWQLVLAHGDHVLFQRSPSQNPPPNRK